MKNIIFIIVALLILGSCAIKRKSALFTQNWQCSENNGFVYQIDISCDNANENVFVVNNFHLMGKDIRVFIKIIGNEVIIPQQNLNISLYSVTGSGSINKRQNKMMLNYFICDGADIDTVDVIYCLKKSIL